MLADYVGQKIQKNRNHVVPVPLLILMFVLLWCYMVRPLFTGSLTGNFSPQPMPSEYESFKNILVQDGSDSRVLWLPSAGKYAYASSLHPLLTAQTLFSNSSISGIIHIINSSEFQKTLYNSGVKYIVIPSDVWKNIYLTDYTYDPKQRDALVLTLRQQQFLEHKTLHGLDIFVNPSFAFNAYTPDAIRQQQIWLQRGFLISCITFISAGIYLLTQKFRRS